MTKNLTIKPLLILVVIGCTLNAAGYDQKLSRKWDKWLNEEVVYIISEQEYDIFMKLETDEQRERFVDGFWLQRDPTPGTEKNEYRNEHYRRLEYASKFYGRDTFRPGWQTDRGKMYILLGEPKDIKRFSGNSKLYPCELWFYQADITKGLPPFFYLIFFRNYGVGEMILYQPGLHRPDQLVATAQAGQEVYEELRIVSPELAHAAYTYLPDESPIRRSNQPSFSSITLMAKIANLNNVGVDTTYAHAILTGMEEVTVKYALSDFQVANIVNPYIDELGNTFIDYAFSYKPEQLEVGQYEETIYGALEVVARLADVNGTTMLSVKRDLELEFSENEFQQIKFQPLLFQDRIACSPGDYKLTVTISNKVSKKYYFFTNAVSFLTDSNGDVLTGLGDIVLNQAFVREDKKTAGSIFPFQISLGRLLPTPFPQLNRDSSAYAYCQVYMSADERLKEPESVEMIITVYDSEGTRKASGEYQVPKSSFDKSGIFDLLAPLPLKNLSPGVYSVTVAVNFSEEEQYEKTTQFELIADAIAPPTILHSKGYTDRGSDILFEYGKMMKAFGSTKHSLDFLQRAYQFDSTNAKIKFELSDLYIQTGEYRNALAVLESLQIEDPNNPAMLKNVAESYMGLQEYSKATKFLERLRVQKGDSTEILNMLADCYCKSGNIKKAIEIWKKSLKLDPNQPHLLLRINEAEKKKN